MGTRERHDPLDLGSTTWRSSAVIVSQIIKRTFVICYLTTLATCLPLAIICWAILRAGPNIFPRTHFLPAGEAARVNTTTGIVVLVIAVLLLLLPLIVRIADQRLMAQTRNHIEGQDILGRLTRGSLHDLPDETLMLGGGVSVLDWPAPVTYLSTHGDRIWRVGINLDSYFNWPERLKRFGWRAYQGMKYLTLPLWPVGLYLVHLTNWYKLTMPQWIAAVVVGVLLLCVPLAIAIALRRKQVWLKVLTDMLDEAYQRYAPAR